MKTTRKTWQTPQVFVLGAEGTQAYNVKGTNENNLGHTTLTIKSVVVTSIQLVTGYQS